MSRPPLPRRPFRDSAVFYAILASVVVIAGVLTGNAFLKSLGVAVVFFFAATAYSWWRFRRLSQRQGP